LVGRKVIRAHNRDSRRHSDWISAATNRQITRNGDAACLVKQRGKFRAQPGAQIGADVDDLGKCALELHVVRNARIHQDAIVEIAGQIERIALRRPRLLHEVDVDLWVEARAHRPQDLIEIAGVDVVVHDNGPFAGISAALAGARHVQLR
jgi:hypothetical protein